MRVVLSAGLICVATLATAAEPISRAKAEEQATALVAQLTLQEKVDQLLNTAPAIPRLGIPGLQLVDGITARRHRRSTDDKLPRTDRPCGDLR